MFSNTTARPVCTINAGVAALGLMTAPRGDRLPHPERYNYLHQQFDTYEDIKRRNVLFQVNLLSLSGYYGKYVKRIAEKLIQENMVEFIGTDMHHANHLKATQDYTTSTEFYELTKGIKWLNNTL